MKDFNVAKYLREHNLGSFGILNHYIDIDALKEEETDLGQQEAIPEPYEGDGHPIDGLGGELDRNMDVSMNEEDVEEGWSEEQDIRFWAKYDRMMGMVDNTLESQLSKIKMAIDRAREKGLRDMAIFNMLKTNSLTGQTVQSLVDDGFEAQDIVDFFATDFSMDKQDYTSSEEFDYMNDDELDSAGFDNK